MLWYDPHKMHLYHLSSTTCWFNFYTCLYAGYGHARSQLVGCLEYFRAGVSIPCLYLSLPPRVL